MNQIIRWASSDEIAGALPPALLALAQTQSLTIALRSLKAAFSVRLLHLGKLDNQQLTSTNSLSVLEGFGRDVYLCLNGVPVVWARSFCDDRCMAWKTLLDCGTRPLGERLFDGSLPLIRSPFEYAADVQLPFPKQNSEEASMALLARRSIFELESANNQLILVECFLPELLSFLD